MNLIQNIFTYKSYKKLFKIKNNLIDCDLITKELIILFIKKLKYDKFIILLNEILFKINITRGYVINYITIPSIINNSLMNVVLNIVSNISPYIKLLTKNINTINIIKNFISNISDDEFNYIVKIIILQKTFYKNSEIINNKIKILLTDIKLVYNVDDINLNILLNIILDNKLDKNIKNKLREVIIKYIQNNKDKIYNYIFYYKKYIINFILKNRIIIAQIIPDDLKEYEDELFGTEPLNFILILMKYGINNGILANILYNYIIYLLEIYNN